MRPSLNLGGPKTIISVLSLSWRKLFVNHFLTLSRQSNMNEVETPDFNDIYNWVSSAYKWNETLCPHYANLIILKTFSLFFVITEQLYCTGNFYFMPPKISKYIFNSKNKNMLLLVELYSRHCMYESVDNNTMRQMS